jgi:MFS family permease
VWSGTFASNIGTWMQNIALGVLGYQLTKSAGFVALLGFAQLGPLLVLALVGGYLADIIDRRRLLIVMQVEQLIFSIVLAVIAHNPKSASHTALVVCVLIIGIGNALSGPALAALLPTLVPRRDLAGAVSLQSVQINLARVIGPALGGVLLPFLHYDGLFALNAGTYVFAVVGLLLVRPGADMIYGEGPAAVAENEPRGLARLVGGVAIARSDPLVRTVLLTIAAISLFCLPFIGLMPVIAEVNLDIRSDSLSYGLLYACFGLGAAMGAISVGSFLSRQPRSRLVRGMLAGFAIALGSFAAVRMPWPAYPVVFLVGFFYFGAVTSMSTTLQEHLDDRVRGRVMALWIMGFGGTVPLGLLAGGFLVDHTSVTAVVAGGAVVAAVLAVVVRIRIPSRHG